MTQIQRLSELVKTICGRRHTTHPDAALNAIFHILPFGFLISGIHLKANGVFCGGKNTTVHKAKFHSGEQGFVVAKSKLRPECERAV